MMVADTKATSCFLRLILYTPEALSTAAPANKKIVMGMRR